MKRTSAIFLTSIVLLILFQTGTQSSGSTALSPIVLTTSCPENVTIYFLDVGQGDSILVKTPAKNILIDGGPGSAGTTVLSDLNAYHVSKIDLMIATHPHEDHIGGLISVLQSSIPVQDIVYNGYNYASTQTYNTWKTLALTHNLTQGIKNQVYAMSQTINFTVISPTGPTQFGRSTNDINDNSIVMRLQIGNTSIMFTGDAQFDTEQSLLSSGYNLNSQVLKVGHHGSSTSTSQAFQSAVKPIYAVISAGINNQYGHPTQQTLDVLSTNNIVTYGTYAYGTLIFSLNSATQTPVPTPTQNPTPSETLTTSPNPGATSASPSPTETQTPTNIPTGIPTGNPSPVQSSKNTPTQDPTAKPNSTSEASATQTAPEFPFTMVILLVMIAGCVSTLVLKDRFRLVEKKRLKG